MAAPPPSPGQDLAKTLTYLMPGVGMGKATFEATTGIAGGDATGEDYLNVAMAAAPVAFKEAQNLVNSNNAKNQLLQAPLVVGELGAEEVITLRHYTSNKGLQGIQADMEIKAYDQNKVFAERAKGKPLSSAVAAETYGISQSSARNYIELMVSKNAFTIIKNSNN